MCGRFCFCGVGERRGRYKKQTTTKQKQIMYQETSINLDFVNTKLLKLANVRGGLKARQHTNLSTRPR